MPLWLEIPDRSVHDVSNAGIVVGVVYMFILHSLEALDLFFEELQFFHQSFVLRGLLLSAGAISAAQSSC